MNSYKDANLPENSRHLSQTISCDATQRSACRHSNLPSAGFLVFSFSMLQLKSPYSTRQAMYYNVTLRRLRESLLALKSNKDYIFLCVRVRVCVCARARVGEDVYICVRPTVRARARVCGWVRVHECGRVQGSLSSMPRAGAMLPAFSMAPPYFSTLCHQRYDFWKKSY